ncbi:filamentous hemagglutinin N-terminal domain-containing protein [Arsenophonus apicola]|uniref:Filamentous hemagglutinin N-terminal domain-containing protein n=1 Tax=Arsenophonus apicola TaxID=2879119 RepID=A0ABY8P3B0_9GAMM|nr:filamentous hemagglutinin N-terminal domain-containing protein [Arsenophonus apicola]WGO83469.1 filamentous hemagglutinin N-terminal domain-containing protein [Arsenophonus apicola]
MGKNKLSFIALSIASILSSFHINASENIIIDNNKKTDLAVEMKNGIEHINIEKADEKGISHNYYQKFNVSEKGVVLNNVALKEKKVFMMGKYTKAYSEEAIAKVIINEVTSNEKSLLKGNLRVNGQAAKLIIVNPYGITCDDCSVSNVSNFTLRSRDAVPVSMDAKGWGAAEGMTAKVNQLPDSANQIVIKNISQPIIDGILKFDTDRVKITDSHLLNNMHIDSQYLDIDKSVTASLDQLTIKGIKVNNYGKLTANNVDIDVQDDFINHRNAEFNIAGKDSNKLTESHFKANKLKFDHASFDISNTEIKFDNNEFDSLNSKIGLKNSIVTMNSNKFSNEDDYRKNDQHHIDRKHSYGSISLGNTKLVIKGNEVVNKAAVTGDGRLEINAVSYTGRKNIKIEGEKTTKIGQSIIKKNGLVNIKAKELLDIYGSKIAASNGLIIDTQQLKSKDGDIKIINKNIKPVVHVAELTNVNSNENWKFADSKKIDLRWKN